LTKRIKTTPECEILERKALFAMFGRRFDVFGRMALLRNLKFDTRNGTPRDEISS
jgi:hypothetical protein